LRSSAPGSSGAGGRSNRTERVGAAAGASVELAGPIDGPGAGAFASTGLGATGRGPADNPNVYVAPGESKPVGAGRRLASNGSPARGNDGSGFERNSPPGHGDGSGVNRPIGRLIERGAPRESSSARGTRDDCAGPNGAPTKPGVFGPPGANGRCGHVAAGKPPGAGADGPFRNIGGCHAIAPRAAAEKGAGALATGLGIAVRELMNGLVQS
jgi:hypothetical protein